MIVLAVLVTFATAAFTFGIGVVVALVSMALFTARSQNASPIKSWGIGTLSVVAMTAALLMRSHSGWGYAAEAAEVCELIFGGIAVLLLVLIGLGQAGLTRLFRRKRASMSPASAAGANAQTPTNEPRHD
jgi:hypothetical protein